MPRMRARALACPSRARPPMHARTPNPSYVNAARTAVARQWCTRVWQRRPPPACKHRQRVAHTCEHAPAAWPTRMFTHARPHPTPRRPGMCVRRPTPTCPPPSPGECTTWEKFPAFPAPAAPPEQPRADDEQHAGWLSIRQPDPEPFHTAATSARHLNTLPPPHPTPRSTSSLMLTRPNGMKQPVSEIVQGKTVVGLLRHLG